MMDEKKEEVIIWGGLIRKRIAWAGSADEVITEDSGLLSRMGLLHLDILRGGVGWGEVREGGLHRDHQKGHIS